MHLEKVGYNFASQVFIRGDIFIGNYSKVGGKIQIP
jgi:hypothetical protein